MRNLLSFILLPALLMLMTKGLNAQKECGVLLKNSDKPLYNQLIQAAKHKKELRQQAAFYYIRVFIHDFISADGTDSAWKYNEIIAEFNQASDFFSQYNMCLVLAGIDYPRNTVLMDSMSTAAFALLAPYNHSYAIDIALHKKLGNEKGSLNGTSYSIPSKWFSLSRGAIGKRSFAHEAGHCLGLAHTFETVYCLECPDGSNGLECGDKIPDTRATPDADSTLDANTGASCVYSGTLMINCNGSNQSYNPEIINIMSYGKRTCRSIFSPTQVGVMNAAMDIIPLLKPVWFEPEALTTIAPLFGITIIDTDSYYSGNAVQIGNNATSFNVLIGGNDSQQKIISPATITITPGVKLLQPAPDRGKIIIRAGTYCRE